MQKIWKGSRKEGRQAGRKESRKKTTNSGGTKGPENKALSVLRPLVLHRCTHVSFSMSWYLMAIALISSTLYFVESGSGKDLFDLEADYNKNLPPGKNTDVSISLFINRVSAVDENKEEISLDVFLQVYWEDPRIRILGEFDYAELTWQQRDRFWVPDLYIRQLREMKVLLLFQEMTSVRLYRNSTMRVSIGATIMIKCDMDFVLYPLDVQKCAVDFSSYKYTATEMNFKWREDPPLSFPSDFGDGYRLPKYVVSFVAEKDMNVIYYGEGNHSTARMLITMSREIRSHLLESYLPSTLFVIMSWGSFVVMPEVVPGRMVLLVTTLLSLVTMFDTIRNNSPNALELKCIEVWIISCTLFVFLSLLEYFVVLFGMRWEKHWRHKKKDLDRLTKELSANQMQAAVEVLQAMKSSSDAQHLVTNNSLLPSVTDNSLGSSGSNSRVPGQSVRMHAPGKVVPTPEMSKMSETGDDKNESTSVKDSENFRTKKFRKVTEYVILYCGNQRGTLDQVSLILFPLCFLLFTTVYWISYIKESRMRMHQ
ncbi:hypothetical protein RUM43_005535 [Polyplax serrata]|uniref:Uncharacterized protein n=1 Tax=Polyplax serrata TaxID=468196 RepID=A0AAN8RUR4_POLSC